MNINTDDLMGLSIWGPCESAYTSILQWVSVHNDHIMYMDHGLVIFKSKKEKAILVIAKEVFEKALKHGLKHREDTK